MRVSCLAAVVAAVAVKALAFDSIADRPTPPRNIFGESAVDVLRQIVEAVRAKYEIPDVSELMSDPEEQSDGEGEEQSAGESGNGGQT